MRELKKDNGTNKIITYFDKIITFLIIILYLSIGVLYANQIYMGIVLMIVLRFLLSMFSDWIRRTVLIEISQPVTGFNKEFCEKIYSDLEKDNSKIKLYNVIGAIGMSIEFIITLFYIYIGILFVEGLYPTIFLISLGIIITDKTISYSFRKFFDIDMSAINKDLLPETMEDLIAINELHNIQKKERKLPKSQ